MNKYIDAEKLIAEIDKKWRELADKNVKVGGGKYDIEISTHLSIKNLISSLQQEQPDYKEAVQLVFEEELTPYKDGNQWCFLLGRNIQDGICGFGDTILDAAINFYKDYSTTRIHIGELKKTMAQPEVELEKEYKEWWETRVSGNVNIEHTMEWFMHETARHFYELGLNARKEE